MPQGFVGGVSRFWFHLTAPLVYPNIVVFGFAAAGKAGNASELVAFAALEVGGLEDGRDEAGEGREEVDVATHGVAPTLPAPTRLADDTGMGGKGMALGALPQLPCLLTAERDDCCVELLSFSTRRPPLPSGAAEDPGRIPLGPGNVG